MTHRLNLLLLALAALVGLPFYWLLLANPLRTAEPQPIDMAQLRALASAMPGPSPTAAHFVNVGWKRVPGNFYAAGSGMKRRLLGVPAFRLEVPGKGPIVIDSGTTAHLSSALRMEAFLPGPQHVVDGWMRDASLILATSERPLHLGGLAAFAGQPGSAMPMARTRLGPAQLPGQTAKAGVAWPAGLMLSADGTDRPHAVAPGVVAIPTGVPGAGSRMFYVRLANGREFVFAGDVAPLHVNAAELRVRSNLLDHDVPWAQRRALMRWLITVRRWSHEAPRLVVVPGHDTEWMGEEAGKTGLLPLG